MLNFEPCSIELLKRLTPVFRQLPTRCAELSAGTIWMWRAEQQPQICLRNDTLMLRQVMNGYPAFTWPVGPDVDGMLDALVEQVRSEDIALRFFALNEAALERLLGDPRFPGTMWGYDRRWSDYLYAFEPFATLAGSEMHRLRYRVNHFVRLYGEPKMRPLEPAHIPAALRLLMIYATEHPNPDKLEAAEQRHSRELLLACHALGLPAAGLWLGDELVAFIIGEVVGETLMIHVQKALLHFVDVSATVFHGFIRYITDIGFRDLRWINWEDDSGDPGLRESKQLYHPHQLLHKFQAHVRAPGAAVREYPVLTAGEVVLTPFREADRPVYYRMNTDRENNRWWGYDYEEDYTVPSAPDENTFYDSAQFDMSVGDSMNFAVRLRADGPMIGEALLWNFTDAGSADIGLRLMPEYHGMGLSSMAYTALIRYAETALGLNVRARCCNDPANTRALRALLDVSFREARRDDTWIYLDREKRSQTEEI